MSKKISQLQVYEIQDGDGMEVFEHLRGAELWQRYILLNFKHDRSKPAWGRLSQMDTIEII